MIFTFFHQSLRDSVPQPARRRLVESNLSLTPIFNGWTELGKNDDLATVQAATISSGYQFVGSPEWDCAISVHPDIDLVNGRTGAEFVHPGRRAHSRGGRSYAARRIIWAQGRYQGDPMLEFFYAVFHSLTEDADPDNSERVAMADAIGRLMNEHGRGATLAFTSYDLNEADTPGTTATQAQRLEAAGLRTIWDEVGHYPDTHDNAPLRAIDGFARRVKDPRGSFSDGRVVPVPGSDHLRVEADISVTFDLPEPIEHPCPACGDVHEGILSGSASRH